MVVLVTHSIIFSVMLPSNREIQFSFSRLKFHLLLLLLSANLCTSAIADPLLVGVFPRRDAIVTANIFNPLITFLEEQVHQPVTLELSPNFEVFLQR
jgi:phosphonate transport system substrate-binding protein